jgi:hypothetical protein
MATSCPAGFCASFAPGSNPGFGAANAPATTRKIVRIAQILTIDGTLPIILKLQRMVEKTYGLNTLFY